MMKMAHGREPIDQDFGNIRAYKISDYLLEGFISTGELDKLAEYFLKAAQESYKNGVEAAETKAATREMAATMGVPWVAFWMAGPVSILA
ncbi:hypothetical protein LguiB_018284 [Lonicera macranthoides]